ncbi:uncharacterized protein LOC144440577 [Glandiceps talaboti]
MAGYDDSEVKAAIQSIYTRLSVGDCTSLVRRLGVSDPDIDAIKQDNHGNSSEQKYQMLRQWKQIKGRGATLKKLYRALIKNGNKDIADDLEMSELDSQFDDLAVDAVPSNVRRSKSKNDPKTKIEDVGFEARHALCLKLNVKDHVTGNDWRKVAEKLGFNMLHIQNFDRFEDPMDKVLTSWSVNADATVGKLYKILKDLGLTEAAKILKPFL